MLKEFRGEMKSLVETYVDLRYPDDDEMRDALFENITSGKASVTIEEMRDYVGTRSSWYAESFASSAPCLGCGNEDTLTYPLCNECALRLEDEYDEYGAESFDSPSFGEWAIQEGLEEGHAGMSEPFSIWVNDEVREHGDITLDEWGKEELEEPTHYAESFGAEKNINPNNLRIVNVGVSVVAHDSLSDDDIHGLVNANMYEGEYMFKEDNHGKRVLDSAVWFTKLGGFEKTQKWITEADRGHLFAESFDAEFAATKGIDTFAEPFEEMVDFYSGVKGAAKLIGLGVLVSVGIWITKNKLLEEG